VTRLLGLIVYNWPLKLAALALATLLYAGLILSQNAQARDVTIPITVVNQPDRTIVIPSSLGSVTQIQYFVADQANVSVVSTNFTATVDLSGLRPGSELQSVRVNVESADPRIQVIAPTPAFVSVRLEQLEERKVPVVVQPGPIPTGLAIDPPVASISEATMRGAKSQLDRVATVRATVTIDESGLSVDQPYPLIAVDELGERVQGVEVEPATVGVKMRVFENRRTKSVPVLPIAVGTPAAGFEVVALTPASPLVTIDGDPPNLANVANARTQPIALEGRSADFDATVGFDLPTGVSAVEPATVQVHVTIRPVTSSRTFTAGIVLSGTSPDREYALSVSAATVTIGGSPVDLDRLTGATLHLNADVGDLGPGSHEVPLTISLQSALTAIAISPGTVTVTVTQAAGGSSAVPSAAAGG
jgi:YbbR domain-containing protein